MNSAYRVLEQRYIDDVGAQGTLYEHIASGARVFHLGNDDDNKVFCIGFRTPPKNSTGVAHIIEHTVLCGSDKYPLKDPFVELVKGSLNTFLNAITYPDKTIYPVASTNDKDFANLMDVYMDAVFHPNIYKIREIFEQEGWHYELESEDGDLTINGVVYNEMKGAKSSPDDLLEFISNASLFPDTTYSNESGGDPKNIPELTYEEFLEFHRTYYHPCNSFIYLYGDMDIDERLSYLDGEYLSHYDRSIQVDSEIPLQKPFDKPVRVEECYSVGESEDTSNSTFYCINWCVGDVLNSDVGYALDALEYALISCPGAPLQQAIIDAGIGEDVSGSIEFSQRQITFGLVVAGANPEDEDQLLEIVERVLREQVANGIDRKALMASINSSQFRYREADFGSAPKGLIYGIHSLRGWLYDKDEPFNYLMGVSKVNALREKLTSDYFEQLVQTLLIDNNHRALVKLVPSPGMTGREDEKLKAKLAQVKAAMSPEEIRDIVEHTKALKEFQAAPTPKEDLEKIPMLEREDLRKTIKPVDLEIYESDGVTILHHDVNTNGIHYFNAVFELSDISADDLPYVTLLERTLGMVDTEKYSYKEFTNQIYMTTGGISPCFVTYTSSGKNDEFRLTMEIRSKFLFEDSLNAISLIEQMILHSDFSDDKRMRELVLQEKSRLDMEISNGGHHVAAVRARAGYSRKALMVDRTAGLSYYRFLKDLEDHYDERSAALRDKLTSLAKEIFTSDRLLVSSTGKQEAYEQSKALIKMLLSNMPSKQGFAQGKKLECCHVNEGFGDGSMIQYVCRSGNFKKDGLEYTGAMKILNTILTYDYFWINVRVQGGAYGCMVNITREGDTTFVSYRDPNLEKTNEVFDGTVDYIRNFDADDRDMTKYVIGTISGMDTPLTPSQRGLRGLTIYMSGVSEETLQRERNAVINASQQDIRNLAAHIEAVLNQNYLCVVGNEEKIKAAAAMFDKVESLM